MRERNLPFMNSYGTVDISTAKNSGEALEIAGLNWDVVSKPIFNNQGVEYDGYSANIRESDGALLGVVGSKYQVVQNRDAFSFVDNLVDEGFVFDRAGQFRGGRSIWVMGKLPESEILGDKVSNNIVFVNSHDGTSGVKIMMTPIRLICSNMLNLALRKAERTWTSKHTGQIFTKLDEARYTLGLATEYMEALNEEAERMAEMKISDDQIINIFDQLFPINYEKDSERKINNVSILRNNFVECYNEDDIKQFRGTVYGAVNAMSDLMSHRLPTRVTESYYDNAWSRLAGGDATLDKFYKAAAL